MVINSVSNPLKNDIRYLKGIGPKKAEIFKRLQVACLKDLLLYFPRRHEDRRNFKKMRDLRVGDFVTLHGKVVSTQLKKIKRLTIFQVHVSDGTGSIIAVWFNQPYLQSIFKKDVQVVLSGKIEFFRGLQIKSPEFEFIDDDQDKNIHTGRIVPIYPLTEGLTQKTVRKILFNALESYQEVIEEYLPGDLIQKYQFLDVRETLQQIHFPSSFEFSEMARKRIVYEELLTTQLDILSKRDEQDLFPNYFKISPDKNLESKFFDSLPFELTEDQLSVISEIKEDFLSETSMNRLLQGDVGSGKTLVACFAIFLAIQNGLQAAFLIPTEILAEQHYQTLKKFLEPFGVRIRFLIGGMKKKEREALLEELHSGEIDLLIGTHAILEPEIRFKNLGLLVIDEQHKFGVMQRSRLLHDEKRPHLLIMTATPIPRTLGLTLYGDLRVSSIKMMPKGRKPIKTYFVSGKKVPKMYGFLKERIEEGEQIYFLFPLVEETEKMDLKAAVEEYESLSESEFKEIPTGLVHGRMKKEEKDEIMLQFKSGEIKILFATSVVEVGIDNPNATCIVIEHAERFGLSQLHQFRGRVGRGEKQSYCFLLGIPKSDNSKQRIKIMTETQDGFLISEADLKLRGPGDFLGTRQSGLPLFLLADLIQDQGILEIARKDAESFLKKDIGASLKNQIFFTKAETVDKFINN